MFVSVLSKGFKFKDDNECLFAIVYFTNNYLALGILSTLQFKADS